ncbi:hypothetical protein NPIL_362851 [Nephila pilipes]|uniref:Uncharacterized protein n=1 Tax=Nephila pilipes TaxID=299642 RepID=A0A8X6TSI5_NEPPI|nr:hypothetical protein NPIL_362851 [Nephila pilipes]
MGVDAGTVRNKLCRDWKRKSPGAFPEGRSFVADLALRADPMFLGDRKRDRCIFPFRWLCFASAEKCAGNMYKEVSMDPRCDTSILLSHPEMDSSSYEHAERNQDDSLSCS